MYRGSRFRRGKGELGLGLSQPLLELFELFVACATLVSLVVATRLVETSAPP